MEDLYLEVARQLSDMGIDKENLSWSTRLTLVALILLISYIMTKLFRHLVIPAVHKITSRTKATWDDYREAKSWLSSYVLSSEL